MSVGDKKLMVGKSRSWTCGFDVGAIRRAKHQTLLILRRCLLFGEVKGPGKVEKDQQNTGEELMMNCHISRKELQGLGD